MKIQHEQHNKIMVFRPAFKSSLNRIYFHWHENMEFLYILNDSLKILIDSVTYEVKKGDLIFIGEHCVHCFLGSATMYLGQFSVSLLLGGHQSLKPVKPHITAEEIAEDPIFEERFFHLLELMKTFGSITADEKNPFAQSIFSAFYFALVEKFPQTEQNESFKKERKDFYRIIEHINENFTNNITVTSIAKSLYMDRGKLSRIFSKYSSMSVNDYLNNLRINKANELLKDGCSVTQAALESGFQSVRTFNNTYKNLTGTTPSQHNKK